MQERVVYRYSMSFKQQVIQELEGGRFDTINQARHHYGIVGAATIQGWLKKYGHNHLCGKVVIVQKPDEKDQIKQLKEQLKRMEQALGRTQVENIVNQEFLKLACERLGEEVESFKKKAATPSPIRLAKEDK